MIQIEVNDAEVQKALQRLRGAVGDLRPALRDLGQYLVLSTKKRFAKSAGQAPDGSTWAPNTPTTLATYQERRAGATVRRKGERLRVRAAVALTGKRPLIGESKRLSREISCRADAHSVTWGSSLEYSATQQFGARRGLFGRTRRGAPIPWGNIPARPFLGVSEEDRAQVLDIVREHLLRASSG